MNKKRISEQRKQTLELLKWILPTVVLFLYILMIIITASSDARGRGRAYAEEKLTSYAKTVSDSMRLKLSELKTITETYAYNIESRADEDRYLTRLEELVGDGEILNGYILDADGKGRDASGSQVDVSDEEWFREIIGADSDGKTVTGSAYEYGTEGGSYMIAVATPVPDGGWVAVQTDSDFFRMIPSLSEFDGKTQYLFVQPDGRILSAVGGKGLKKNSIIFDEIPDQKLKKDITGEHASVIYCKVDGEERVLVLRPFKRNGWFVCELATGSFIDSEVEKYFAPFKKVFINIILALIVFLALTVGASLLMRKWYRNDQKQLKSKAETDLLTGLLNKISTEQTIQDYLNTIDEEELGMFVLFDIDNFKNINDSMGHAFGDEVLVAVGKELTSMYRTSDIIGRLGGDEFAVFLKDIPNDSVRLHMAETTLKFFQNFKVGEYTKYSVTASIGAAMFPKDGKSFEELYKAADKAVYKSKHNGRNRFEFYDGE